MSSRETLLVGHLDETGLVYVRAHDASTLAFEGINGVLSIKANWTKEAGASTYVPTGQVLNLNHVVIGAILDDLARTSRQIADSSSGPYSVELHGTPLSLSIENREQNVILKVIESISYSDHERTLGIANVSREDFLLIIARLIEIVADEVVSENRSLRKHPVLVSLLEDAQSLRVKA